MPTLESDEDNDEHESTEGDIEDEPEQNEINRETWINKTRNDSNKERNGTVVQDVEEADPRITGVLQGNEPEETEDGLTLYPFMLIFPNKRRIYYLRT